MSSPSQIILLVEDGRHRQFIFRYLRQLGFGTHAIRILTSPPGSGSAEQWVRQRFPIEIASYRRRQAATKLLAMIDADNYTVSKRRQQLGQALHENNLQIAGNEANDIVVLIPKRNIETWILCLNGQAVDEGTDYKAQHHEWTNLIHAATIRLYTWTRSNTVLPTSLIDSLHTGIGELRKLG